MDDTAGGKVIHLCVFLAMVGAILFVGWNEPLGYRFMSQQEIDEIERPPVPVKGPWVPKGKNPLDKRPYSPR